MKVTLSARLNRACTLSTSPSEWSHFPERGNEAVFSPLFLPKSLETRQSNSFFSFILYLLTWDAVLASLLLPDSTCTSACCRRQQRLSFVAWCDQLWGHLGLPGLKDLVPLGEVLKVWSMQCAGKCCLWHSEYNTLWTFAFLLMSLLWGLG